MVNQLKIITMTQLALYDKHEGQQDRIANDYFRHDYIYRNNLGTRLAVGFGSIVILLIYWLQSFVVNEMDLFEINIQQHVTDSVFFILAVLAVYSLLGTIQGTRQYYLVQKRLAQYQALVRQLERLDERARRVYDDEEPVLPDVHDDIAPTRPIVRNTGPTTGTNPCPPVRTAPHHEQTRPIRRTPPVHTEHTRPIRRPPEQTEQTRPRRPSEDIGHTRPVRRPSPVSETRPRAPLPQSTSPPSTRPPLPPRPTRPRPTHPVEHTKAPTPDTEPKE